ncbi:MAG: glycerate kinase [Bacteroidales bacterium]|nr:glycerate kinase [Bacteroidales bacterium]
MNILIAPDSFKESLSATEVCRFIESGIKKTLFNANITSVPLSDGGEGFVQTIIDATSGRLIKVKAHDPLMRPIDAEYGILGDNETAIIEMTKVSGLELLSSKERNPWITTTYGTGELIRDALNKACKKLIIGIGGSATNDGGAGMIEALGGKLLTTNGKQIEKGGGALKQLATIDLANLDKRLSECQVLVACDVINPLLGKNGASFVFARQKGANSEMIKLLEENLSHYANIIQQEIGKDISDVPGTGAAGGIGAGLIAFLNAELKPGFDIIRDILNLDEYIKQADLIFTAEGKVDFQTQFGKTPFGVAQVAKKYNKPVICLAGSIGEGVEVLYNKGILSVFSIINKPMLLDEAIANASLLLEETAERVMRLYLINKNFV